jgi:hypothetical protein
MRLVTQKFGMTLINNGSRPGLKRNVVDMERNVCRCAGLVAVGVIRQSAVSLPKSFFSRAWSQQRAAVCSSWCGLRRYCAAAGILSNGWHGGNGTHNSGKQDKESNDPSIVHADLPGK